MSAYETSGQVANPAATKKKGLPLIIIGALLLVLGIIGGVGGFAGFIVNSAVGIARDVEANLQPYPGSFSQQLEAGDYTIYQDTSGVGQRGFTSTDVTITGPDGASVPTFTTPGEESSISTGSTDLLDTLSFTAETDGTYDFEVRSEGAGQVYVGPSVLNVLGSAAGWIVASVIAGLIALLGLVLLIVGIVVRARSGRSAAAVAVPPGTQALPGTSPSNPPANWYPDPERPGGMRYWDGTSWTENRS